MITMMYGFPGAGKSAHAVKYFIIEQLKAGQHVYTNISGIDPVLIQCLYNIDITLLHILTRDELTYFWRLTQVDKESGTHSSIENVEHGSIFVIDEIQLVYGTGMHKGNTALIEEARTYATTHRHRRDSVIFLTVDPDQVAKFARDICEHWSHVRKANFLFGANTTTYIVNHRKGGRKGKALSSETYKLDFKACSCYRSTRDGKTEIKTQSDKVTTSWFKILWPIPVVLTMIGMGIYMFKKSTPTPENKTTNAQQKPGNTNFVAFDSDNWICDALTGCDWYYKGKYVSHTDSVPRVAVGDHDFANGVHIRAIGASLDRYGDSSTVAPMADPRNGDPGAGAVDAGASLSFGGPGTN